MRSLAVAIAIPLAFAAMDPILSCGIGLESSSTKVPSLRMTLLGSTSTTGGARTFCSRVLLPALLGFEAP